MVSDPGLGCDEVVLNCCIVICFLDIPVVSNEMLDSVTVVGKVVVDVVVVGIVVVVDLVVVVVVGVVVVGLVVVIN